MPTLHEIEPILVLRETTEVVATKNAVNMMIHDSGHPLVDTLSKSINRRDYNDTTVISIRGDDALLATQALAQVSARRPISPGDSWEIEQAKYILEHSGQVPVYS